MNYKITRKLVLFIVSLLLLFSVLMSVVFACLFSEHTLEYHQEDLKIRAEAIASNLTEFLNSSTSSGSMGMGGMGMGMNGMKGYMPYLRGLEQVAMGNVWIVDRNASIIYESKGLEIESQELPPTANEIIEKALSGSTSFSETFSDFIGIKSLTVGVPILDDDKEVIGAVLLHAPVNNIDSSILSGLNILFISAAIALVLAILLGTLFSLKFIAPIKKINKAAYKLSEGDYSTRTQVIQNDEIGDLAKTVDQLALRLDEASRESSRLEQSRRDFIASVSHELRTPVTVLRGSLEALKDGIIEDEEQKKQYQDQMFQEVLSLQRLVDDLLSLTKLQNPDFKISKELLNLSEVLSDGVDAMKLVSADKEISLSLANPYAFIPFSGDYGRLRQMFMAVLDNAIKFSPKRSSIDIEVIDQATKTVVKIRDYGIGMEEKVKAHIFDKFFQISTSENLKGTGLGLSIVNEIALRHQVSIDVESRKGEGTVFTFTFLKEKNPAG